MSSPCRPIFFVFGGIYRSVALIATDLVHVDMLDFWRARIVRQSRDRRLELRGRPGVGQAGERRIDSADGYCGNPNRKRSPMSLSPRNRPHWPHRSAGLRSSMTRCTLNARGSGRVHEARDPYLYKVVMTVRSRDGLLLDEVVQPLGLRSLHFDSDKGLFLNGEHLFLKGASMHQDRPVKGWAISQADQAE